jgi:hypothetical protein
MTDRPSSPYVQPDLRTLTRPLVLMVVRVTASIVGLGLAYYLLPFDHSSIGASVTILVVGLIGFIALVAYQIRAIMRSSFPGLKAIEALATSIPLFLLLFAATYISMAHLSMSNFGAHLTHTDGLYFTVTVFSTVGFGDITPKSEAARLVVTGQMITDLIILGLVLKVVVGAVSRARKSQSQQAESSSGADGTAADNADGHSSAS